MLGTLMFGFILRKLFFLASGEEWGEGCKKPEVTKRTQVDVHERGFDF